MKNLIVVTFVLFCLKGTAQITVFSDNFSTGISNSWTLVKEDQNTCVASASAYNNGWISLGDSIIGSCSNFNPVGTANRWIISPILALGAFGNELTFRARSFDASFPDAYQVLLSTTGTNTADFTNVLFTQTAETPAWDSIELNLTAYINQNVYIAFKHNSVDKNILFLDDFKVVKLSMASLQSEVLNSTLSPNPCNAFLKIKSDQNIDGVAVFDLNGSKIELVFQNETLNTSTLSKGIYYLHLSIAGVIEVQKIVKL